MIDSGPRTGDRETTTPLRLGLVLAGLATLVVTAGFIGQAGWATDLWPWRVTPLSYLFLASILAAIALPVLWIGVGGELAAMRAGAVDLAITYGAIFVYLLTLVGDPAQPTLWAYVIVFGLGALGMVVTLARTRAIAWIDRRPMPVPVRASFGAFALMLIGAGVALVAGAEIFPWSLGAETSVIFGFIYLGAAAYFITGLVEPAWPNAQGQLIGFLAYDLVLIGPFVDRFDEVNGGELTSLIIYTAFVVYSGALAAYYLFAHSETRLRIS